MLSGYDFPGNVRELQAMVFDAVSRRTSRLLSLESFQDVIQQHPVSEHPEASVATPSTIASLCASLDRIPTLKETEECLILEALKRTGGNQTLAARLLGTTRQKIHRRIRTQKDFVVNP